MKDPIKQWVDADAEYWQFWMPQSGATGGLIMGLVLCSIFFYFLPPA